ATFTVTSVADSGPGSLRSAINHANGTSVHDLIAFDISGTGVHVIRPHTRLPEITKPVTINGNTQDGASPGHPTVVINGSLLGQSDDGLVLSTHNSVIRGLVVNGFGHAGIEMPNTSTGHNVIAGNFLGTDVTGTHVVSSTYDVDVYSPDNRIGGVVPA